MENKALVGAEVYAGNSLALLKEATKRLLQFSEILAISSVYSVNLGSQSESFADVLSVVYKLATPEEAMAVLEQLKLVESETQEDFVRRRLDLDLLVFNDLTVMTPSLTLPHPEFHLRPHMLVPAAEVWGSYHHPVLDKSLSFLSKGFQSDWGRFYCQGKSLLDF